MVGGYTGKILIVDLDKHTIKVDDTHLEDAKNFIGAKGLGAKYLIDNLPKNCDPISPENLLIYLVLAILHPTSDL